MISGLIPNSEITDNACDAKLIVGANGLAVFATDIGKSSSVERVKPYPLC
jgi:hypothetical protein